MIHLFFITLAPAPRLVEDLTLETNRFRSNAYLEFPMTSSTITIRPATPNDLHHVMAIVDATVDEMANYGNEQWDATYPRPQNFAADIDTNTLIIAEQAGEIAGFLTVDHQEPQGYRGLPWSAYDVPVIHRFAVAPASRRTGVARALVDFVFDLARHRDCAWVKVDTHSTNLGMQRFLKSRGFVKVGEMTKAGKEHPYFCYECRVSHAS